MFAKFVLYAGLAALAVLSLPIVISCVVIALIGYGFVAVWRWIELNVRYGGDRKAFDKAQRIH